MKEVEDLLAKEKITKARAGLVLDHPFWGSLVLRGKMKQVKDADVGWTDGRSIGYNPETIKKFSIGQIKTFLAHEWGGHVALAHHARRGNRNPRKWNKAGDYAVNNILDSCGFEPIEGWLMDHQYDGQSIEQIYGQLSDEPDDQEGSGGNPDPGGCGEVRDFPGADGKQASPAEMAQAMADAKVSLAQAAQQARAMGNLPGAIARIVEDLLEPKIDWREVLRRFISTTSKNDYAWNPPNRRFIHRGLYLPSMRSDELPTIVVGVDTSGSISEKDLSEFAAEISGILSDYQTTVEVVYCDSDVAGHETYQSEDLPIKLKPLGGGGTDFRPVFEWVDKQGIDPACVVYLTDLCCNSYPDEPGYPVLWVQIGDYSNERVPFGDVMHL
jgi:predicted metal-dependent peptidase